MVCISGSNVLEYRLGSLPKKKVWITICRQPTVLSLWLHTVLQVYSFSHGLSGKCTAWDGLMSHMTSIWKAYDTCNSSDTTWKPKVSWRLSLSICAASVVGNFPVLFLPACHIEGPAIASHTLDTCFLPVSQLTSCFFLFKGMLCFATIGLSSALSFILPMVTLKLAPPK